MGSTRARVRLCCVGGGKMGEALIQGLLSARVYRAQEIRVVDTDPARREHFETRYRIGAGETVQAADLFLLAVKPKDMETALGMLKDRVWENTPLVSIAAGISTDWISERLGPGRKVVRAMPNAAALVQKSATGLYFSSQVGAREREAVLKIFRAVGVAVVVDREEQMDMITGLSGSGPGYVFLLLEAFADAGVGVGLSRQTATELALQTFLGSAAMSLETGKPFSALREMIMSPGGTTAAGLRVLEEKAVRGAVMQAVEAATRRAGELCR